HDGRTADADGAWRGSRSGRTSDAHRCDGDCSNGKGIARTPRRFELDRRKGRRIGADGQAAAGLRPHQGALHVGDGVGMSSFHELVATAQPPAEARATAARAFLDTIGVTYAGAVEPAARAVQRVVEADSPGPCAVVGTSLRASAGNAALANGTA